VAGIEADGPDPAPPDAAAGQDRQHEQQLLHHPQRPARPEPGAAGEREVGQAAQDYQEDRRGADQLPVGDQQVPVPLPYPFSKKIFAYADDGTLLLKMEFNTLNRVKTILRDFAIISGLNCNVDKTFLMQIGSADPIPEDIRNLGFAITNEITVLGMKLGGIGVDFIDQNITEIRAKVIKQVNFWTRFNLSLPGRINVSKSLIYSQLNYLGSFLPVPQNEIENLNEIICNFVKGNMNIARKRFFQKPEHGGLGIFEVGDFLRAQKCSWVKRAQKMDDGWKQRLFNSGAADISNIRTSNFNKHEAPVLYTIAENYEMWRKKFWEYNENFRLAPILNNPIFTLQRNSNIPVTLQFFQELLPGPLDVIFKLTLADVHNGERFLTLNEFRANTNIQINERKLIALRGVYDTAVVRHKKEDAAKKTSMSIQDFFTGIKKGCRKFKMITTENVETIPHNIVKFANNTETVIDLTASKLLNSCWNISYLDNDVRVFLFKLHNNTLGYNSMISRFVDNVEPYCTFCTIARDPFLENETVLHTFYTCIHSENLLGVLNTITGNDTAIRRNDIFLTFNEDNTNNVKVLFIVTILFKKYIWDCKLRKCLPLRPELEIFLKNEIRRMKATSKKFRTFMANSDYGWFFP